MPIKFIAKRIRYRRWLISQIGPALPASAAILEYLPT